MFVVSRILEEATVLISCRLQILLCVKIFIRASKSKDYARAAWSSGCAFFLFGQDFT